MIKTEDGGREGTEDRGHPSSPLATPWQGGRRSGTGRVLGFKLTDKADKVKKPVVDKKP